MHISSLVNRAKKFFSKKRRVAKFELGQIHADGFTRTRVERDAREFQTKALKYEANSAFHNSREKKLRRFLHNSRVGRSDDKYEVLPPISTTIKLSEEADVARNDSLVHSNKARDARNNSVVRRLYSQKLLKSKNKK